MQHPHLKTKEPNKDVVVFPRPEGDVVFHLTAIQSFKDFEAIVPEPKPPRFRRPGDTVDRQDTEDPNYIKAREQRAELQVHWTFLQTVSGPDGFKWDTIDEKNPETWGNYQKELEEAGFTQIEINRLIQGVMEINLLDDTKLEEARLRFLASQSPKAE